MKSYAEIGRLDVGKATSIAKQICEGWKKRTVLGTVLRCFGTIDSLIFRNRGDK